MDPFLRALELLSRWGMIGPGPNRDMIRINFDDTADPLSFIPINIFDKTAF
jgi:hypothetical protein